MTKFGLWLKHWRISLGLSQEELARRSGVPQSTIADLEIGKHNNPRLKTLRKLAKGLYLPLGELVKKWEESL